MRYRFPTHYERRQKTHAVRLKADAACYHCGGPVYVSPPPADASLVGWNADFCPACDRWLDRRCFDHSCDMCLTRPSRPSLIDSPMRLDTLEAIG